MRLLNKLSVLLPVYNAQGNLDDGVAEILDVLAELATRFELWILDDGSTDDTADEARHLAARYPQIRLLRHPVRLGLCEAIQTGLDHMHGEIVLVGDEDYCLDPDDLRTLWQLRDTQWRLRRQAGGTFEQPWIEKLVGWRSQAVSTRRGFQIILPAAFEQFRLQQAFDRMRLDVGQPAAERPNFLDRSRQYQ